MRKGKFKLLVCLKDSKTSHSIQTDDFYIEADHIPRVGEYLFYSFGGDGMLERKVTDIVHPFKGQTHNDITESRPKIWIFLDKAFNHRVDHSATSNHDGSQIKANSQTDRINQILEEQKTLTTRKEHDS